jgi:hypothetical protein
MLDVTIAVLALFVCFLVVPAFMVGLGFAAAIPLFGLGLLGQLWSRNRTHKRAEETAPPSERVKDFRDWQKSRTSTEEEVWRHTG